MPIIIRSIDHERKELDGLAFGAINYADVEKHLLEERRVGVLVYKEFIDARDAGPAFALSPAEIRQIVGLVRTLGQAETFGLGLQGWIQQRKFYGGSGEMAQVDRTLIEKLRLIRVDIRDLRTGHTWSSNVVNRRPSFRITRYLRVKDRRLGWTLKEGYSRYFDLSLLEQLQGGLGEGRARYAVTQTAC